MLILFPQTCILLVRKFLLYFFEDNEAVIKMIMKERSPTMRHVSRTHRVALDWLFDRINLDPKIQIKYIDTKKTKSQTYWPREISHVMNGIIFCVCSTSAISVPPIVLQWCRKERKKMLVKKESQQNPSRWWIWSRDTAQGIQTCLPRMHQKAPGQPDLKVKYLWARGMSSNQERWDFWWALAHQITHNGTLTKSGLLKSGNLVKCWKQERGGRPFTQHTDKFVIDDDDMDSRKILKQSSTDAVQDIDKSSLIFGMFMSSTLEASVFMGKNYSEKLRSIENTGKNLTSKQMFEISEKLILEQSDEIFWSVSNQLEKFSREAIIFGQWWRRHQSLACEGSCIFGFCVMSWKGESEPNIEYCLGRKIELVQRFTTVQNFGHNWRRSDGIRVEYFPRIHHIAARQQSPRVHDQNGATHHNSKDDYYLHFNVQRHHKVIWRQWTGMHC